jgi:hypothetical protein
MKNRVNGAEYGLLTDNGSYAQAWVNNTKQRSNLNLGTKTTRRSLRRLEKREQMNTGNESALNPVV